MDSRSLPATPSLSPARRRRRRELRSLSIRYSGAVTQSFELGFTGRSHLGAPSSPRLARHRLQSGEEAQDGYSNQMKLKRFWKSWIPSRTAWQPAFTLARLKSRCLTELSIESKPRGTADDRLQGLERRVFLSLSLLLNSHSRSPPHRLTQHSAAMLLPPSALLFGALSFASSSLAQTLSLPSTPNGGCTFLLSPFLILPSQPIANRLPLLSLTSARLLLPNPRLLLSRLPRLHPRTHHQRQRRAYLRLPRSWNRHRVLQAKRRRCGADHLPRREHLQLGRQQVEQDSQVW